ncbi:DNA damage-inducible protein DinB [Syncephalis plumigaleata]|nr:DNA damage-inducible protein DinB [Syncephalis plumigaleata]
MTASVDWKQHFIQLAECNASSYKILLESIAKLSDEQFNKHTGLCFRSIHGTLNHLVAAEKFWYSRFSGNLDEDLTSLYALWTSPDVYAKPDATSSIWEEYIPERSKVIEGIQKSVDQYIELVKNLPDSHNFEQDLDYIANEHVTMTTTWRMALTHIFNHATHHRGQISAAITQLGLPPPSMDFTQCPGVVRTR